MDERWVEFWMRVVKIENLPRNIEKKYAIEWSIQGPKFLNPSELEFTKGHSDYYGKKCKKVITHNKHIGKFKVKIEKASKKGFSLFKKKKKKNQPMSPYVASFFLSEKIVNFNTVNRLHETKIDLVEFVQKQQKGKKKKFRTKFAVNLDKTSVTIEVASFEKQYIENFEDVIDAKLEKESTRARIKKMKRKKLKKKQKEEDAKRKAEEEKKRALEEARNPKKSKSKKKKEPEPAVVEEPVVSLADLGATLDNLGNVSDDEIPSSANSANSGSNTQRFQVGIRLSKLLSKNTNLYCVRVWHISGRKEVRVMLGDSTKFDICSDKEFTLDEVYEIPTSSKKNKVLLEMYEIRNKEFRGFVCSNVDLLYATIKIPVTSDMDPQVLKPLFVIKTGKVIGKFIYQDTTSDSDKNVTRQSLRLRTKVEMAVANDSHFTITRIKDGEEIYKSEKRDLASGGLMMSWDKSWIYVNECVKRNFGEKFEMNIFKDGGTSCGIGKFSIDELLQKGKFKYKNDKGFVMGNVYVDVIREIGKGVVTGRVDIATEIPVVANDPGPVVDAVKVEGEKVKNDHRFDIVTFSDDEEDDAVDPTDDGDLVLSDLDLDDESDDDVAVESKKNSDDEKDDDDEIVFTKVVFKKESYEANDDDSEDDEPKKKKKKKLMFKDESSDSDDDDPIRFIEEKKRLEREKEEEEEDGKVVDSDDDSGEEMIVKDSDDDDTDDDDDDDDDDAGINKQKLDALFYD